MIDENKLLEDLGKYLEEKGWKPIVISFQGITQRNLKNNFSLIIDFTGYKKGSEKNTEAKK